MIARVHPLAQESIKSQVPPIFFPYSEASLAVSSGSSSVITKVIFYAQGVVGAVQRTQGEKEIARMHSHVKMVFIRSMSKNCRKSLSTGTRSTLNMISLVGSRAERIRVA